VRLVTSTRAGDVARASDVVASGSTKHPDQQPHHNATGEVKFHSAGNFKTSV